MLKEKFEPLSDTGEYITFEGIKIQWNRFAWKFDHPNLGLVSIDTYSIWNPNYHKEIAGRLAKGETCALYMMGNFGVAEIREMPEWKRKNETHDAIFDDIKQRDRLQNLVVFQDPEEIRDLIDIERLPSAFKKLRWPEERLALYPGPMHAILPIKDTGIMDSGLVREQNKTAAFFWIPGHFGYEALARVLRRKVKHGLMGGGSLNIHGQEPCYTSFELRNLAMIKHPEWIENVDFVIFDEIAEAGQIGRSHTQVSFIEDPPRVVRIGSLSHQKISRHLGFNVVYDKETVRFASSQTPYDAVNNKETDEKIGSVLSKMRRFRSHLKSLAELSQDPRGRK